MLEKLKNENKEFVEEWEISPKKGFKSYVLKNMILTGIMMFLIYLIDVFVNEVTNYLLTAIIYILIAIIAPFLSWGINEKR